MSNGNYENKILDAIQKIVDNAVSKAHYDKTIKGIISKCSDEETGKYVVKYQDSSLIAYSADTDASYSAGEMVYVLIPGNDMTQVKTIIGSVDKLGTNYLNVINTISQYSVVGNNIISSTNNNIGLCSYTPDGDAVVLYDKNDSGNALINLDTVAANAYLKQSKYMICGASFKTNLDAIQQYKGDYGIAFDLDFIDNNTGESVVRTYLVNINEMKGNPYNYLTPTEQLIVFDIDGENFQGINKISFYCYDFPVEDAQIATKDLFISDVVLEAAEHLTEEELLGNSLTFITLEGIYFNNNDGANSSRSISAQIKIDNTLINANSNRLSYYWFKENNQISSSSDNYNRYGGIGWECLNNYNTITEEGVTLREWLSAGSIYTTTKANNSAKENTYKCVAVYNNSIILSKEITLYNYSSAFDITIASDSGTYFSYDVGNPTLTCYVNGSVPEDTQSVTWNYSWAVKDNNNNYTILEETTTDNTTYNNAVAAYENLKASIEDGTTVLTADVQQQLATLAATIEEYNSIMRIEKNNIYKLKLNTITNFSTYTCFVYRNNSFVGKSSITIVNDLNSNRNSYNLVINNGNQVFKYNENGIAPTNKSLDNVQEIFPLSFTLFDDSGKEIDNSAIKAKDVEWTVPISNSLITISATHGNPTSKDEINETATYTNYKELYFTIANIFNASKDRNTIQLRVKYKDRIIIAKTDLIFIKEGEVGTNGTDFVCRIVPNAVEESAPKYPTLVYNKNAAVSATNPTLNYTPGGSGLWLKAELWHDGIRIFDGITTGTSGENKQVKVEWEILKNKYKPNINDVSNLIVDRLTGVFNFNNLSAVSDTTLKANPANIIKCTLTYDGIEYYATMPITLVTVNNSSSIQYRAEVVETSGFRYVMYTTDGAKPIYDSANPFALKIYEIENNIEKDITDTILTDYIVNYSWSVKGLTYGSTQWNTEQNLIEKTLYSETLKRNERRFIPIDTCNGLAVNNALYCSITRNNTELMNIHIPIHLYLNKYGNAALNGWDGNHIEINNDGGFILAPQIGAGKKNNDNSFTGVFMGSVKEAGQTKEEFGLYGYNAGERTIALNAEDGSARFGKSGMGQIVLDPTDNTATLKSGNYIAPVLDDSGNIITAGQGLEIDLTDPHITFGSGKFRVDSDGQVYAQGFATIADLTAGNIDIPGADNFQLEYATDAVQIETDANLDPLETTVTKTINLKCLYKKQYTSDYSLNLIDSNGNIITHNGSTDGIGISISKSGNIATISFTARKDRQIAYATNSYLFRFAYTPKGDIIDKYFNVNLVIQGKDGVQGATGPVGPAGKDGTSVTVKGSYATLADLKAAAAAQSITPVAGDGYIIGNDLYVFTNGAGGGGSQDGDWTDVGQFKGDDAKNCVVTSSAQVFKSTNGGISYTPNNITLTPYKWAVDWPASPAPTWQYYNQTNSQWIDLTGTLPTGISINSSTKVLTVAKNCALFTSSISAITFKCLTEDNDVYDTMTVVRVTDGVDGNDGQDGDDAYTVILTNEAQTIAGDNTKAIATSFSTGVIGYKGTTQVSTTVGAISGLPTGITKTINNNGTTSTSITFNVANTLTTKNGQITIPVTIDGKTFNKILSYSLALKGSDGIGISGVINYYAVSQSNMTAPTSGWTTDVQQAQMTSTLKYLWNYEKVNYSNSTSVDTDPAVIGVYGDTGLSSTDGMPDTPPIRRWTFDKVVPKVIGSNSVFCYPENNNSEYDFQRTNGVIVSQYGKAVFDGTQNIRTDASNIDFNNTFSISFWLNYQSDGDNYQTIFQNRKTFNKGLAIFINSNKLRFDIGGVQNTFNKSFVANTNYHVVLTYNPSNGQQKLYVNGAFEQTITIVHTDQEFTSYLWSGMSSTNGTSFSGNVFKGTLDDLRIYDYVLDLDNIDFLYRSNGQEAANGGDGRGLSEVVEYYLATSANNGITKNSTGWTTTIQTVTSTNKYLWNYEKLNYTDGSWSETDPVIIGTYGDKGDKGDPGVNAINILLTNEAQVIAGDTSKAIATTITTDILGFVGSTQTTVTVAQSSITGLPTGMTASVNNHDNISTITFNVTTSMTTKSGQVTIPVNMTVNGEEVTMNKIFSYSLSLKGATGGTGAAASMVDISATSQVFKSLDGGSSYAPNEITLTPRFQTVTYQNDETHGWFYSINGGTSFTKVTSGSNGLTISGNNLKISKTCNLFSSSVTSIVFKCISSNTSVFDTMTIVRLSDGTNGVGVSGYDVNYQTSNSGTTVPTGTWQTSVPSVNNGQYLWTRTRIYYTNSTTSDSYSVSYKGTNGTNGTSVTITTKSIQYAEGSDGTTVPTTGWQNSIPAVADGKYLWTKTYVKYSDNNETTSYSVSYQSADGLSLWTTTATPTNNIYTRDQLVGPNEDQTPRVGEIIVRSNRYQYTITAVSGNNITVGTAVDLKGATGTSATNIVCGNEAQVIFCDKDGKTTSASTITIPFAGYLGNSRKACTVTYSTLPTGITLGSNTAATTSSDGSLVLNVANNSNLGGNDSGIITLTFSCNSLIFIKKFSWSKAKTGLTGNGINSVTISYGISNSSSTQPSDWSSSIPQSIDEGKYLWTRTIIDYTDPNISDTVTYTYSRQGVDGENGAAGTSVTILSIKYQEGSSATTAPTGTWSNSPVSVAAGKYLWTKTTFSDNNIAYGVARQGINGINGSDAYTVILSNESHTFPATSSAATASSVDVDVIAYKGATLVTPTIGTITGQVTGLTTSINGTTITVSASTSLTTQSGVLNIPVTVDGKSFTKKFSWSLAKAGTNGTSPTAYSLIVSHAAITKTTSGTYSPASIILTAKSQTGNAAISNFTTGRYAIFLNGSSTATTTVTSTANYSYTIPADTTSVRIALYNSSTGTTILDEQTIPVVMDGINGTSPFTSYLTNESQMFAYGTANSITTQLYGYQGTTEKTVQVKKVNGVTASTSSTATGLTGMNFKVSSTNAVNHPTITFEATTSLAQTQTVQVPIIYRITGESADRTIYFSYATTTQGATGTAARIYEIDCSTHSIVKNIDNTFSPSSIIFSAYYRTGTGTGKSTYSGTWWIQKSIDGNTWTDLVAASTTNATKQTLSTGSLGDAKLIRAYLGPASTTPTSANALDIQTVSILSNGSDGFSLWTTTAAPSSNTYTRSQLVGPTETQAPRVGEIIIRSNRYQYTITAVSGDNITVGPVVDLRGSDGTSPFISYLTNETQSFVYAKATSMDTSLYGYQGTTEKTVQIKTINGVTAATTDTATGKTGMNFKVSSTSAVSHPKITFTTTTSLPQGASEKLAIVYRVTGESSDRTIYFTYSTTTRGAAGTDASLVDISASSQIFKSTDGGTTFAPDNITLTPRFQTVTYSKWQYSVNGGSSWTNISSGSHGLTISGNNLTISKDSDLYTDSLTAIPFKCVSSNPDIYDVMTIAKLYDTGDIKIGGRNYYKNSKEIPYSSTYSLDKWTYNNTAYSNVEDENGHYLQIDTSTSYNAITQKLPYDIVKDKTITISYDYQSSISTILDAFHSFQLSNTITSGRTVYRTISIDFSATNKWVRKSYTIDINDALFTSGTRSGSEQYFSAAFYCRTNGTDGRQHTTFKIRNFKLEIGNKATDWSPAPEDYVAELKNYAATVTADLADIQSQIDNQVITWFYSGTPILSNTPANSWTTNALKDKHIGDYYYNTDNGNAYKFTKSGSTYSWTQVSTAVATALSAAAAAQDTADHKRRVFYSTPTVPYDKGDLWVEGSAGDIKLCNVAKTSNQSYAASDWILASKYTDDTVANQAKTLAQTVQTDLANLSIGGRNLVLGTNTSVTATGTGGTNQCKNLYKFSQYYLNNYYSKTATVGESLQVTISYDWTSTATSGTFLNQLNGFPYSDGRIPVVTLSESNTSGHFSHVWTLSKSTNATSYTHIAVRFDNLTGDVTFSNLKIEVGNKETDWSVAPEDTTTYVDNLVSDLQTQVDGKIQTYSQTADPSSSWTSATKKQKHTGDLWYNPVVKITKRWSGSEWVNIDNAEAEAASVLASTKAQVFTGTPTVPYYKGDLWITALDKTGVVKTCKTTRTTGSYTSGDWVEGLKYTDDTIANQVKTLAQTVQTDLNNLEIGGRNLILNGSGKEQKGFFKNFTYDENDELEINKTFGVSESWQYPSVVIDDGFVINTGDYEPGETLIWSYDIKWIELSGYSEIGEHWIGQRYTTGGTVNWQAVTQHDLLLPSNTGVNEWYHYEKKITIPSTNYPQPTANTGACIQIGVKSSTGGVMHLKLRNVKLERGNKATDWTPAPEDVNNAIGQTVKSITELYYLHTSSSTAPTAPTEHVTSTSTSAGVWTTKCPTWASGKYYWTCSEILYASGTYAWTTPLVVNGLNSANTTADTANNKINNLEIGGTNILKNSNAFFGTTFWTKENTTTISQYISDATYNPCFKINVTTANQRAYQVVSNVWKQNQTYIISGYIKASAAGTIRFSRSTADYSSDVSATTSWKYFSTTITSTATADSGTLSIYCRTANVDFYLANLKFEEGNIATAWSPSPLDTVSSVDVEYYLSTSNTGLSGGSWSTIAPTWVSGKYLWTRNKITWKNTTTTYTDAVLDKVLNDASELGAAANNKIDNLKIGNRNLLLDTADSKTKTGTGETNQTGVTYQLSDYGKELTADISTGWTYTISFDWTCTATNGTACYQTGGPYYANLHPAITFSSSNQSGHIENSGKITSTTENPFSNIRVRLDNVTGDFTVSHLKLEVGNKATDWSEAPEDTYDAIGEGVVSAAIQYAANASNITPPSESDNLWSEATPITSETKKYIWMRTYTTYLNGEHSISTPICISFYEKKLIKTVTEYAGSTSSTSAPNVQTGGWSEKKPTNTNLYIWTRVISYYSDGTSEIIVAAYCDSLTKQLQDKITEDTTAITNELHETGVIRMFNDEFYALNTPDPSSATQVIRISSSGIAFAKGTNLGWNTSTHQFTNATWNSVWGIDGTFDAQSLNVINLNASEIQDGVLELGRSSQTNGQLNIYTTNGSSPTIIANGNGIIVKLENGGEARITKSEGIIVTKGSASNKIYGSTSDGEGFETDRIDIEKEINFGSNIKGLVMTATVSGVTHRGVGFIKM